MEIIKELLAGAIGAIAGIVFYRYLKRRKYANRSTKKSKGKIQKT